jgi:hypothetical protein
VILWEASNQRSAPFATAKTYGTLRAADRSTGMAHDPNDPLRTQAADLATRHGISEEQAYRLLCEHGGGGFEEALQNLSHFLKAPS